MGVGLLSAHFPPGWPAVDIMTKMIGLTQLREIVHVLAAISLAYNLNQEGHAKTYKTCEHLSKTETSLMPYLSIQLKAVSIRAPRSFFNGYTFLYHVNHYIPSRKLFARYET